MGDGFHFGFLFGIALFGLLGFYLLRVFLWNSYGKETIIFTNDGITYEADYGWFKSSKQFANIVETHFMISPIGYEDENLGVLIIRINESTIETVTKLPQETLEKLIQELKDLKN